MPPILKADQRNVFATIAGPQKKTAEASAKMQGTHISRHPDRISRLEVERLDNMCVIPRL